LTMLSEISAEGLSERDQKRIDFYMNMGMLKGAMLVKGLQGGGKTTWGVHLAWWRRHYFGFPVVSNVLLREEFGDYTYIDSKKLVEEFRKVNVVIEEEVKRLTKARKEGRERLLAEASEEIWKKSGCNLYRATVLIDEGYEEFERRRGMSPKVLLNGYLVQMWRHYQSLIVVLSSSQELVDRKRLLPFITHEVLCSFDSRTLQATYEIWFKRAAVVKGKNPAYWQIYVPNYGGVIFDSDAPVGVPEELLRSVLK